MSGSEKVTVVQYGRAPLLGGLQEPFEQRYNVVKDGDPALQSPDVLKSIEGLIMYGTHFRIDAALLDTLPSLKVVSTCSVGFDHIDLAACKARNVAIGHTPGAVDGATADVAWSLILAAGRRVMEGHRICTSQEPPVFKPNWFGKEVSRSTLGVVGMGGVGFAVARRALGFDMKVLYHNRRRRDEDVEKQVNATYVSGLKELMSLSDFVVCCVPASPENAKLFSTDVFSAAKQDSVFVNVSRGPLVDHDALLASLRSGRLFGAGLDVTDPEPLPRGHPLLQMDNVVLMPHVGTATLETRVMMIQLALRNLQAGLDGRPLERSPPMP